MRRIIAALAIAFALALPGVALAAGGSTCQAYNPQLCSSTGNSSSGDAQTLPFTGIDIPLLVACGAGLLGAGAGMRRLVRNTS